MKNISNQSPESGLGICYFPRIFPPTHLNRNKQAVVVFCLFCFCPDESPRSRFRTGIVQIKEQASGSIQLLAGSQGGCLPGARSGQLAPWLLWTLASSAPRPHPRSHRAATSRGKRPPSSGCESPADEEGRGRIRGYPSIRLCFLLHVDLCFPSLLSQGRIFVNFFKSS